MSSPSIAVARTSTINDNTLLSITEWYCEDDDRDMKSVNLLHGTKMTGPQWLQILCVVNGFRSTDLADMLGISVNSVDTYRCGRGRPSAEIQKVMRKVLNMPENVTW